MHLVPKNMPLNCNRISMCSSHFTEMTITFRQKNLKKKRKWGKKMYMY